MLHVIRHKNYNTRQKWQLYAPCHSHVTLRDNSQQNRYGIRLFSSGELLDKVCEISLALFNVTSHVCSKPVNCVQVEVALSNWFIGEFAETLMRCSLGNFIHELHTNIGFVLLHQLSPMCSHAFLAFLLKRLFKNLLVLASTFTRGGLSRHNQSRWLRLGIKNSRLFVPVRAH